MSTWLSFCVTLWCCHCDISHKLGLLPTITNFFIIKNLLISRVCRTLSTFSLSHEEAAHEILERSLLDMHRAEWISLIKTLHNEKSTAQRASHCTKETTSSFFHSSLVLKCWWIITLSIFAPPTELPTMMFQWLFSFSCSLPDWEPIENKKSNYFSCWSIDEFSFYCLCSLLCHLMREIV